MISAKKENVAQIAVVPEANIMAGLQVLAVFCCELVAVSGKLARSLDVLRAVSFMDAPGFLFSIYEHEDAHGHRMGMIEAPDLGIGRIWCKRFALHAGADGHFARIICETGEAEMVFLCGRLRRG